MKTKNQNVKILIVDDIPKNIQVVGSILMEENYDIYFANNGENALSQAFNKNFNLILLDIMMPGLSGYDVCRELKNNPSTCNVPIIFLTAKVDTESLTKAFDVGGQDYVTKPFNSKELLSRVRTHIDLQQKTQELMWVNENLENKVKDRTQQLEEANQRLSRLDKAKNDFLLLINHELRTPLNGIIGFSRILQESLKATEHEEFIKIVNDSANRLEKLSEVALLITMLRAEGYDFKIRSTNLSDMIELAINLLEEKWVVKNIQFQKKYFDAKQFIYADEELIVNCLSIIIDNAIKFSPQNGKITIETEVIEPQNNLPPNIKIHISDQGSGFSPESLSSVFELFSTDNIMYHSEGFGLGLATAKVIIDNHSGKISAHNLENGGACISILIPFTGQNTTNNTVETYKS